MNKHLIFVAVSLGLFVSSSVKAQSGFYAGVAGGGSIVLDQSFETDVLQGLVVLQNAGDIDVSYDTGYNISGHVGYQIDTNIRIETELGYSTAGGERQFTFDDVEAESDQDLEILQVTAGIFLDLWPLGVVVPYVGGGIGYANVTVDNDDFGEAEQDVFMAFAEGGVPYTLSPSLALVPSARFNWYRTKEKDADDIGVPIIGDDLYSFDLRFGVNYSF